MFYSQLNNNTAQPIETVRCGLSCFSIHFHIPKRKIKSTSTSPFLTPSSSSKSLSTFLGYIIYNNCHIPTSQNIHKFDNRRTNDTRKSLSKRMRGCIEYLWITRISIQFNSIPCLIILLILCFFSIFLYIENQNGHYYFHQVSTLSFLSSQTNHSQPTLYDLHQKLSDNYPNAHVIAGKKIKKKKVIINKVILALNIFIEYIPNAKHIGPPLSREDLGHISWLFLHTQGVTYSEEPTEQRKKDLLQFWESFSRLYPCGECAKHIRSKIESNPPNVENNKVYSQWLCDFHNDVTYRIHGADSSLLTDCNDIDAIFNKWSPNEFCGCDNQYIEGVDDDDNIHNNINNNMDTVNSLGDNPFLQKNTGINNNVKSKIQPRLIAHNREGVK